MCMWLYTWSSKALVDPLLISLGTEIDGTPAGGVWLRPSACVLATGNRGRTGRGYGIFVVVRKGHTFNQVEHACRLVVPRLEVSIV